LGDSQVKFANAVASERGSMTAVMTFDRPQNHSITGDVTEWLGISAQLIFSKSGNAHDLSKNGSVGP
jgi:hypothetical protein